MSFRPHIESQSFMVKSELETSTSGAGTTACDDQRLRSSLTQIPTLTSAPVGPQKETHINHINSKMRSIFWLSQLIRHSKLPLTTCKEIMNDDSIHLVHFDSFE
jgi:hypothetical protein